MSGDSQDFGDRLTALMRRARLKNPDVAAVTKKDPTTVSKWRSGRQVPPDGDLAAIVELLAQRGVHTTVHVLRHGEASGPAAVREAAHPLFGYGEVDFETVTAKQSARVELEGFLLQLAKDGAGERFIADARRLLLNPANYTPGFADGRLSDEDKLRHMRALAAGLAESLKQHLKVERRELPPRMALRQPPGVGDTRGRKRR